jgi:hypothetical protein
MATFGSVSDVNSITNIVKGDIPSYMNVAISTTNNQCGPTSMTSTSRYNYYVCFTGPQPFNYIPSTSVSNAALGISSPPSSPTLTSDNSTIIVVGALISGLVILGVATLVTLHLRRTARHRTKVAQFDFNRNLASQSSVMMNPLNHTRQEPIPPPPPPDDTVILPTPSWQQPLFGARPSPLLTTAPPPPPPAPFTLSSTTTVPHERVAFDPVKYAALNRSGRVLPVLSDVARISQRSLRLPNVEEGNEEQTAVSTRSLSVDSGIPRDAEPHLTASVAQRKAELMRKLSTKDFKPMVARRI